jgi:hypothetical protein
LAEENPYTEMATGVLPHLNLHRVSSLVDPISSLFSILWRRWKDLARAFRRHSPLLYVALSPFGIIGSTQLKDLEVRYIRLTSHVIDSCEPHKLT